MIYAFVVSFALGIAFEEVFGLGWSVALLILILSFVLSLEQLRATLWGRGSLRVALQEESQRRPLKVAPERASLAFEITPKIFFIIGVAFCLGVLRMEVVDISPDQNLLQLVGQKISFEAVVSEEADQRDTSTRYIVSVNQSSLSGFSMEWLASEAIHTDDCLASLTEASTRKNSAEFYPCNEQYVSRSERVLLVADRFPEFKYGDGISVSGKLELPKNFEGDNGTEFDYVSYLSKDNIHFIMYRPEINLISSSSTGLSWTSKIISTLYGLKNIFIEKISAVVPEPNASFLGGIIFGAKQSLGNDLLDDFRKVGLIHIVVLSGYNITIIAAGVFLLTDRLGKRNLGFVISAICIALFAIMVGLGATVIRASIMALIAILARFLGRPAMALRWLFIAGALMLLYNPLSLLRDPSFQLSFMATLGLILFSPFVYSFISRQKFLSKIIPEKLALREIVSATLAVQFFILPLLIKMAGFVSVVSFIINPIVLPLIPWAMALGGLTGALGILPLVGAVLSWPFGALAYLLTQIIISLTEIAAGISFSTFQTGTLPFTVILIWYGFYGWVYFKLNYSSPH